MNRRCIACNGRLVFFGPRRGYEYYICTKCSTLQLFPMPDEKQLQSVYEQQYASAKQTEEINDPDYWETAGEAYRRDILKAITDHDISGLIIDFGAGWGHLCKMLIKNGFNCKGVEPSLKMSSHCRQKGIPVVQGSFGTLVKFNNISSIVMCAVFEHLTAHRACLHRFNRALPLGGRLITLHPTAACYTILGYLMRFGRTSRELPQLHGSFSPPWHTALFSLQAMEILARDTGFEVIDIRPASQGNVGGMTGLVQQFLGIVNRAGWFMMGQRWPLITTHVFVLKKIRDLEEYYRSKKNCHTPV